VEITNLVGTNNTNGSILKI